MSAVTHAQAAANAALPGHMDITALLREMAPLETPGTWRPDAEASSGYIITTSRRR